MPVDSAALLKGLKPLLKALEKDLLARAQDPGVDAALKLAWKRERDASRTGDALPVWRRRRVTQVAVAWMAVSPQLVAGYATLYGIYYAAYAWILFFARISWPQAVVAAALAVASLFAASNTWLGRADRPRRGSPS